MIEQLQLELECFFEGPYYHSEIAGTELISISLPYTHRPFTSPLAPDAGIYWNSSRTQTRRVAFGEAWRFTTSGVRRFEEIQQQFSALQHHWLHLDPEALGVEPHLFLQYAFDDSDPMEREWSGLPNTVLQLPGIQLSNHNGLQWVTLSHPLNGQQPLQILDQWEQYLKQLEQLLGDPDRRRKGPHLQRLDSTPFDSESSQVLQDAIRAVNQGPLEKIVPHLSASLHIQQPFTLLPPLQQLERQRQGGTQLLFSTGQKSWLASPPELLLRKQGDMVETEALAGTAPRGSSRKEEQQIEQQIIGSTKLQREHQLVADHLERQLNRFCKQVERDATPTIQKLNHLQHLLTRLHGTIDTDNTLFQLIDALQQSPAVCGTPKGEALNWLRRHHNSHRGYYCGGAGWISPGGNGEIHVLLRCALFEKETATFYAGAGVVAGSNSKEEADEIWMKIQGLVKMMDRNALSDRGIEVPQSVPTEKISTPSIEYRSTLPQPPQ